MSETQIVVPKDDEMTTDDDRLAYTQGVRKLVIGTLTKNGTEVPSDKSDRALLIAAVDGMDRTAIQNKKIGSNEKQGAADRQAALLIAKMTKGFGGASPFEREPIEGTAERVAPVLDMTGLPELELAPGETAVGIASRNYQEFMSDGAGDTGGEAP